MRRWAEWLPTNFCDPIPKTNSVRSITPGVLLNYVISSTAVGAVDVDSDWYIVRCTIQVISVTNIFSDSRDAFYAICNVNIHHVTTFLSS